MEQDGVGDFITSELLTFAIQTFLNSFFASFWPAVWYRAMGIEAFYWAGGGYLVWAVLLVWALSRREKALKKELGLGPPHSHPPIRLVRIF